jgi:hypothetical protein
VPPISGKKTWASVFDPVPESQRSQNLNRAAELRARLLAQRQQQEATHASQQAEIATGGATTGKQTDATMEFGNQKAIDAPKDPFSVESLLAEGKTAAAAKGHEKNLTSTAPPTAGQDQAIPSGTTDGHNPRATVSPPKQSVERTNDDHALHPRPEQPQPPTNLTDAYYANLPLWLEVTGYHDIEHRNSQLSNMKERKRLEQDAARIAERLAKLNQDAQVNVSFKHSMPTPQPGCEIRRHPLPAMMPSANAVPAVAGVKRAHSPVELLPSKMTSGKPKSENHPTIPCYNTPQQLTSRRAAPQLPTPEAQREEILAERAAENARRQMGLELQNMEFKLEKALVAAQAIDARATGDLERRITFPEPRRVPQDMRSGRGYERAGRAPSPERYHPSNDREARLWRDDDLYEPPRGDGSPRENENQGRLRYSSVNIQDHNGGRNDRRPRPHPERRRPNNYR